MPVNNPLSDEELAAARELVDKPDLWLRGRESRLDWTVNRLLIEVERLRAALAAQRQTAEDIAGYLDNLADHAPIPHAYAERIRGQTKRLRAPAGSATPTGDDDE